MKVNFVRPIDILTAGFRGLFHIDETHESVVSIKTTRDGVELVLKDGIMSFIPWNNVLNTETKTKR